MLFMKQASACVDTVILYFFIFVVFRPYKGI